MFAVISLIVVLALSVLVTRIATVALAHTGLSREAARFQARSAFTGVGFTTEEAEAVVNHPVRRRILMILMLLGNAGIVTAMSSFILTFISTARAESWLLRLVLLVAALSLLWTAAHSQWLDRWFSRWIEKLLSRWTDMNIRDYARLLQLGGEYMITELHIQPDDWMADRTLAELRLRQEGIVVLGIQSRDGRYLGIPVGSTRVPSGATLVVYGRAESVRKLGERRAGPGGSTAHDEAVAEQARELEIERAELPEQE
jgi:hypothetical protein